MAFNFSALQFDQAYQPIGLQNWELPRFAPPRPRLVGIEKAAFVCDNNGHLLPSAKRDGNSFGQYRGTYQLPDRITREFVDKYDACLTGRYKFRDFPRDLCPCYKHECDKRKTLGEPGDPYWEKPKCMTKCAGWAKVRSWKSPKRMRQLSTTTDGTKKSASKRTDKKIKEPGKAQQQQEGGMSARQQQLNELQQKAHERVQEHKKKQAKQQLERMRIVAKFLKAEAEIRKAEKLAQREKLEAEKAERTAERLAIKAKYQKA